MGENLKARGAVSVHLQDGTARYLDPGHIVNTDELADYQRQAWSDGDKSVAGRHFSSLFDKATASEARQFAERAGYGADDPVVQSMLAVEQLTRERVGLPAEERHGTDPTVERTFPVRGDAGRTLPESGADTPADERYAARTHELPDGYANDRLAQGLELGPTQEATGQASDAPRETAEVGDLKARVKELEDELKAQAKEAEARQKAAEKAAEEQRKAAEKAAKEAEKASGGGSAK